MIYDMCVCVGVLVGMTVHPVVVDGYSAAVNI